MPVDALNAGLFSLAALILLGSPGPGIAALISVGRTRGFIGGLPFFGGLQIGLAAAAAISAAGLFSLLRALPFATTVMTIAASLYLAWLAWSIATAPVGAGERPSTGFAGTALGGFLLGVTNPKAYIAFVSLMASYVIIRADESADVTLKWTISVAIMIVVDSAWLGLGVAIRRMEMRPATERWLNIAMGGAVLVTAVMALV